MKALFNGVCTVCWDLKPRCARVVLKDDQSQQVVCADCRKNHKGEYNVEPEHKSGNRPEGK